MSTTTVQFARFRVVLTFLLVSSSRAASAQIGGAEFTGTVHDEARAPIPGVTISVTNVTRRLPVWRGRVELRGEIFNLLNTPPLGTPAAVLGAANFGTITAAGDPRVIQLAVKYVF